MLFFKDLVMEEVNKYPYMQRVPYQDPLLEDTVLDKNKAAANDSFRISITDMGLCYTFNGNSMRATYKVRHFFTCHHPFRYGLAHVGNTGTPEH